MDNNLYLYQQIEEQDEQIEKASKVIETLTAEIEQQQKEILRLKFENEFLNQQNKILEKDNLSLQKESNNIDTIRKGEVRQKQINHTQKEKIEKYQTLFADQEMRHNNAVFELNENIRQLTLDNQEKMKEIESLHKQGQQQQLAINQVMEILEQKEQELQQLNEFLNQQKESQANFSSQYKQSIDELRKFTENLFIQSDKNLVIQVTKGKVQKNVSSSTTLIGQYKTEEIDESHIYDIILKQGKYINEIYQKLQDKLSNEQLSEFIVQVNYMRQYFEAMEERIQDVNMERNVIYQAYLHILQQSKTQQSFIEQLMSIVKNQSLSNTHFETISEIQPLDTKIMEPLNEQLQLLFSNFREQVEEKEQQNLKLSQQNKKLDLKTQQLQQQLQNLQTQVQQQQQTQQQQQVYQAQQAQQQQQQSSQQLVSLLYPKGQKKSISKTEQLEKENQQLIEQLNELSKEHEETVRMLEKAITQLEQQAEEQQHTQPTTKLVESQIDRFLESCSLLIPMKSPQTESVVQKTNILIDLVTMLTDSQHDILQKLLVTFLVTRDNRHLHGFEKDFQELKSNRHNFGILDYLDKLECLKNQLLSIIEKELKCEYAIPYGKSILIQTLNAIAQKYMEIVQQDSQLIEAQMKKYKNHITIYKMYKQWKECILDFSEILFEIIESIDCIGQPQFESKLNKQVHKLNYRFIDSFND